MLNSDYGWQGVEIVIGGVATVPKIHFMTLLMSLGRILLQGSLSTYQFDPVRHHVHPWPVQVGI